MKRIEAVILPSYVDAVRVELRRRGIGSELMLTEVRHGETHLPLSTVSDGSTERLTEKVKLELILADRQVDKAVTVILRYAVTGFLRSQRPCHSDGCQ